MYFKKMKTETFLSNNLLEKNPVQSKKKKVFSYVAKIFHSDFVNNNCLIAKKLEIQALFITHISFKYECIIMILYPSLVYMYHGNENPTLKSCGMLKMHLFYVLNLL